MVFIFLLTSNRSGRLAVMTWSVWWNFCCIACFQGVFCFPEVVFFNFFCHYYMFDVAHFQYSLVLMSFLPLSVLIFSWFGSSIPSVIFRFPIFIISMVYFLSQIPYLYPQCISSLSVFGIPIRFLFLAKCLTSSMYIKWLIFCCDSWNLYRTLHFISMIFNGIIAITIPNGHSTTSWKISVWISTSTKLLFKS